MERVFQAVHHNNADPKILAYEYFETLPHLAKSDNNTFWVIPGELTEEVRAVTSAFGDRSTIVLPRSAQPEEATADDADGATDEGGTPVLEAGTTASLDAASAADEVAKQAAAPVSDAMAEAEAARTLQVPGRAQASGD
ncbi:hypothetical protein ACFQ6Q_35645 [Streptomyces sp. NPDC056437]|uniref:hypothetical protein n=1 Tax=Streptomyces sp. NPDC056437 TaxID=3345816 RepID=UPI0036AAE811